uniref:Single-pass membrane protein with coiled-coil domains 2 n=1 Tax=Rousettus aegyptiacus TaxID=9407 RepID=A0A7J8JNH1_ROUAE|nr:single-pass membrane protein with coiled-coil domains 2 [Rousettus aegyptiacus]
MAYMELSDMMALQIKAVGKKQQLTEENNGFLQNIDPDEGAMENLLREFNKMDHFSDRSDDDEGIFLENPQTDYIQENMLELEAEHNQDLRSEQDEEETVQHEDPQVSTSLQFSEENIPEFVLNEVVSLEGQIEKLESHQDFDPAQGTNIEADACNEAHELKEKLVVRKENFCKDMSVLDSKLGMYQMQAGNTDSQSAGEVEPLLLQASPPPLVQNSPPRITMWKRVLRIFIMFYVLTITGLSCYILFFDATFIFERVLPAMLGHRGMWELREIIAPFLNLEVEDLLPS